MIVRLYASLAATAAAAILAGCGSDSENEGSAAAAGASSSSECPNNGTVRFAVEPYETSAKLLPVYDQIVEQLSQKLGCKVELTITQNYTAEIEAMRAGKLEAAQFGPLGYVLATKVAGAEAVASYGEKGGEPDTYFASIVAPKDKGISSLDGVKGKDFVYSDPASTSGHLFPAFLLKEAGIDPDKGVKPVYAGSHTSAFEALRNGKVDAGELNSQTIESAQADGTYESSDFVTLAKSKPIPVDPIAVRGDLTAEFKKRFVDALLAVDLSKVDDPREILTGDAFVAQDDTAYQQIRDLAETLGIGLEDVNG
jgi:phosphonate transport system substrate-binding protein